MAAEVQYHSGPQVQTANDAVRGTLRGDAVMWVRVGKSEQLRPVTLTNTQLVALAAKCLAVLQRRMGE